MKLDPYTLEAGLTYSFFVTATVDNGGVGSALLTVFVETGSVYVSIAGASSLIIPYNSPLSLDASNSVLEDLSPVDPNNVVQLSWSCVITDVFLNITDVVYGDLCDEILSLNVTSAGTSPSTDVVHGLAGSGCGVFCDSFVNIGDRRRGVGHSDCSDPVATRCVAFHFYNKHLQEI